jgi:hypothetical protein
MMEQMVTFGTQVKGNCLDLVITIYLSEAGRLSNSDHEMLLVTLTMDRTAEASEKPSLNWKRANWPCMREHLPTGLS